MKFDTIKVRAEAQYVRMFEGQAFGGMQSFSGLSDAAFSTVLPFLMRFEAERAELKAFSELIQNRNDGSFQQRLATLSNRGEDLESCWRRVLACACDEGVKVIRNWDVRSVSKLIELFPDSAPARMRDAQLNCYMADNEDSDWMVEVAPSQSPRPSMRR